MELPKIEAKAVVHENLVPAVMDEVYQDMAMHVCTRQPVRARIESAQGSACEAVAQRLALCVSKVHTTALRDSSRWTSQCVQRRRPSTFRADRETLAVTVSMCS